jgi:dienelactone hydrolase
MAKNAGLGLLAVVAAACGSSAHPSSPVGPLEQALSSAGAWGKVPLQEAASYSTTIPANGDAVDIYYPADRAPFPVVVLLQGADVDKGEYATYAGNVARFGFVVLVPNQYVSPGGTSMFATEGEIPLALAFAAAEGGRAGSPIEGRVDATRLGLLGHSYGSVVALYAVQGSCEEPFCTAGAYVRPPALRAAALWGVDLYDNGVLLSIDTSYAPVALLEGAEDGMAPPEESLATYGELAAPKAYVTFAGVNHYGLTDDNDPPGADPDPSGQTVSQAVSVTNASLFAGLFLRARVSDDTAAAQVLEAVGSTYAGVAVQVQAH